VSRVRASHETRRRLAALATALLFPGAVTACGDDNREAGSAERDRSESRAPTRDPGQSKEPKQRQHVPAEKMTCTEFRDRVTVTFRVSRRPDPRGQRIYMELSVRNRTPYHLSGSTDGWLGTTASADERDSIVWGGSSADFIDAPRRATSTHIIRPERTPWLLAPAWARISILSAAVIELYGDSAGDPVPSNCSMPAHITAPPGFVIGHPTGSFTQTPPQARSIKHRAWSRS